MPFARSSLNHDDIFVLDTASKIFQFNGSNSSIQERAKALEVVQHIKDTYHDGKCEIAAVGNYATTCILFLYHYLAKFANTSALFIYYRRWKVNG